MKRTHGRECGSAYLILLVLAVTITMIGTTMIVNSTSGAAGEAMRDAQDRARCNAESGLTLADLELKRDLPVLIKRVVEAANAEEGFSGLNMLAGLQFDPVDYHFEIPGEGNTENDAADVHVEVTLPGPAFVTNLSGVGAGPELGNVETYCFVANLRSSGRTEAGATFSAERVSHVYVSLVLGEIEAGRLNALGAGNVIVADGATGPLLGKQATTEGWGLVPMAHAAGDSLQIGSVTIYPIRAGQMTGGGTATGSWTGEPREVVPGERRAVGLVGGDMYYYFYVRGLPEGSYALVDEPSDTPGARGYVLATDSWRFTPNYNPATDTVPIQQPDGTVVRKMGTPNYGVLAVKAPVGLAAAQVAFTLDPLQFSIFVPGVGVKQYEVTERSWVPETVSAGTNTLVGWPAPDSDETPSAFAGLVGAPGGTLAINLRPDSDVTVESFVGNIGVPGDVPANGQMLGVGSGANVPGTIPLMLIQGRRAQVTMSYDAPGGGRATADTTNAGHRGAPLEGITIGGAGGGGGIPIDPPPPGVMPKVRIVAIMYVPLWTSYNSGFATLNVER